jgi:hypothetical protein
MLSTIFANFLEDNGQERGPGSYSTIGTVWRCAYRIGPSAIEAKTSHTLANREKTGDIERAQTSPEKPILRGGNSR